MILKGSGDDEINKALKPLYDYFNVANVTINSKGDLPFQNVLVNFNETNNEYHRAFFTYFPKICSFNHNYDFSGNGFCCNFDSFYIESDNTSFCWTQLMRHESPEKLKEDFLKLMRECSFKIVDKLVFKTKEGIKYED